MHQDDYDNDGDRSKIPQVWSFEDGSFQQDWAYSLDWERVGRWVDGKRLDLVASEWTAGERFRWVMWVLRADGSIDVMYPARDIKEMKCASSADGST